MSFLYGTALIIVAILLLGAAKHAVTHLEESSWVRAFAATEALALLVTCITAFGFALLGAGIAANDSGLGIAEFGASLGAIVLSAIAAVRIFRAAGRRARTSVTATKPDARATS